jgi:hypothetical protein
VRDGYKVYTDTSWAVGFGARWLLTEIEKQGVGGDRVFFGSDEPWSDFDSEYWKLNGDPRHLPGAQGPRVLAQLRRGVRRRMPDARLDDRQLLVELQSLGVRVSTRRPARCPAGAAAPGRRTRCSCGCAGCR